MNDLQRTRSHEPRMKAAALRTVLLVKAIEEQDADGAILPIAEREAATRSALRRWPAAGAGAAAHRDHAWRVLEARADELSARLAGRHPVIARTVALESHATQAALVLLVLAFALGLMLSVLDSRVRIEIVAFPLLGLVAWNLAVYVALALAALRRSPPSPTAPGATNWLTWPARWSWRRAAVLIKQSAFYHRVLAAALRRFSDEWWPAVQPLLVLQGKRIFHLASAAVALGLIAGFYLRGIAFEYRAGWESTFLGPSQVRSLLHVMYAPAASISGIALPADNAAVEALHWREGAGGGPAAPWIHLIAVTAVVFVVLPRLALALAATFALARASTRLSVPDSLLPYVRSVLGQSDAALPAEQIEVVPFAYRPDARTHEGAVRLLQAAFGADARIEFTPGVGYGVEDSYARQARAANVDVEVLLFSLASTPEQENHGAMLAAARQRLERAAAHTRLMVLVDESAFLASMAGDPSLAGRIEQRREAWRTFVTGHGLEALLVDVGALRDGPVAADVVDRARLACRGRPA